MIEIDLDIECYECKATLEHEEKWSYGQWGPMLTIRIVACPDCIEKSYDEGRKDAE